MRRALLPLAWTSFGMIAAAVAGSGAVAGVATGPPANGHFAVAVLVPGGWTDAGTLSFAAQPASRELDLSGLAGPGPVHIRIVHAGATAAHLDAALLGGGSPIAVEGAVEGALAVAKAAAVDHDLLDLRGRAVVLVYESAGDGRLAVTGRVEPERITTIPFQFPPENTYTRIDVSSAFYEYSLDDRRGGLRIDGSLAGEALGEPFFAEHCRPGTGHPPGVTHGWVANDDEALYVALDFLPDNTMDGEADYARVHVRTPVGVREYPVSVADRRWGAPGFEATARAAYQHKVYEMRIPLDELRQAGVAMEEPLRLAFAAYGTAAPPTSSIHALKYEDVNGNGSYDAGDLPLSGIPFQLTGTDAGGGLVDLSTTTDGNGEFAFVDLGPSDASGYTVTEQLPAFFVATTPVTFSSFLLGGVELVWQAGAAQLPPGDPRVEQVVGVPLMFGNAVVGTIHGLAFEDVDGDGVQDAGEPALSGISFTLTGTDGRGSVVGPASSSSLADGSFLFTIPPGSYSVAETVPAGWVATTAATFSSDVLSRQALVWSSGAAQLPPGQPYVEAVVPGLVFGLRRLEADVRVTAAESADPVVAGSGAGGLIYTVTLDNLGPDDAPGAAVAVDLTLPAGVTVDSMTPSAGVFTPSTAPDGVWSLDLAAGASATLTITLAVGSATVAGVGVVSVAAAVTGVGGDVTMVNPGDDTDSASTSVTREVDVRVSKTESADPVTAGSGAGNLTYVVTVANDGPSDAGGVVVSEVLELPAGVTLGTVTTSAGSWASPTWAVGELAAGGSATLTVVLTVGPGAVPGADVIGDTATVSAVDEPDVNPANDTVTELTSIIAPTGVVATKVVTTAGPTPGAVVSYRIVLANDGPGNLSDGPEDELIDVLPPELVLLGASASAGAVVAEPASNTVRWNGPIPAGESVTIDVNVRVRPEVLPGTVITNQGTVRFDGDGDGVNEAIRLTDDPAEPGEADPTLLVVEAPLQIPVLGSGGLTALALLLALAGAIVAVRLRWA